MKTQQDLVIKQLMTEGYVTRNWALRNFISRLGAIMCDLKKEGWNFTAKMEKWGKGKDYVYRLTTDPQPLKVERYYSGGELVATKLVKA